MNDEPTITPPQRAHMAALLIATACAIATGVMTVLLMGAGSPSAETAALAIAGGVLLMAWPAMLTRPMPVIRWGMILIATSTARIGAIMIVGLLLSRAIDVQMTAYMLGLAVGAITVLMVETILLMRVISALKPALVGQANGDGHA